MPYIALAKIKNGNGYQYANLLDTAEAIEHVNLYYEQDTRYNPDSGHYEVLTAKYDKEGKLGEFMNATPIMDDIPTNQNGRNLMNHSQAFGSGLSFARKQSLQTAFNIVTDEDVDRVTDHMEDYSDEPTITEVQGKELVDWCAEHGLQPFQSIVAALGTTIKQPSSIPVSQLARVKANLQKMADGKKADDKEETNE